MAGTHPKSPPGMTAVGRLRRPRVLIAAALVAAGLVGWQTFKPKPKAKPPAPLIQQVTALGRLTPYGGFVTLSVPAGISGGSEVVDAWLVEEGAEVRKGELLARLSSYPQLEAGVEQAQAKLNSTKALLPYLKVSQSRGKQLYSDGAISEEELARTTASIITKEADIGGASAALDESKRQLRSAEIRSPLDGRLIRIYSWPGMKESSNGLAVIGRTGRMQVWAQVFQTEVARLRIGQGATIKAETGGFAGERRARLSSIIGKVSDRDLFATDSNNDVNARVVLVKLDLDAEQQRGLANLAGLNVTVRFDS